MIYLSCLAYLPEVDRLAGLGLGIPDFLGPWIRSFREVLIWCVGLGALRVWWCKQLGDVRLRFGARGVNIPRVWFLGSLYLGLLAARSLMEGVALVQFVSGLRIVPFLLIAVGVGSLGKPECESLARRIALGLRWFVVIQFLATVIEMLIGSAPFGKTLLGPRAMGSFSFSNNMGMAMLFVLCFIGFCRVRGWRFACGLASFCIIASGCRSGILGLFAVLLSVGLMRLRYWKLFTPTLSAVAYFAYLAASWRGLSGREIDGEGRVSTWAAALGSLHTPVDVVFGGSLGLLSNAAVSLGQGGGHLIADSTLVTVIGSYGIVGLAFLLVFVISSWRLSLKLLKHLFVPSLAICALSFNVIELPVVSTVLSIALGLGFAFRTAAHGTPEYPMDSSSREGDPI